MELCGRFLGGRRGDESSVMTFFKGSMMFHVEVDFGLKSCFNA